MTAMGIHLTDALISMFGAVHAVHAVVARRVLELPSGDVVSAQLSFRNGVIGSISAVSATPFYGRLAVFGSLGWTEIRDDDHPERGLGATLTTCRRGGEPHHAHVDNSADSVLANLESFADAVGGVHDYRDPRGRDPPQRCRPRCDRAVRPRRGHPVELTGALAWDADPRIDRVTGRLTDVPAGTANRSDPLQAPGLGDRRRVEAQFGEDAVGVLADGGNGIEPLPHPLHDRGRAKGVDRPARRVDAPPSIARRSWGWAIRSATSLSRANAISAASNDSTT